MSTKERHNRARGVILPPFCIFLMALAMLDCRRPQSPAGSGEGRLPPEMIQRLVRQRYRTFRKCYEDGLGRDPNLQGKVEVRFVIDLDGRVKTVEPTPKTDMADTVVTECILAEYKTIRFPRPEG